MITQILFPSSYYPEYFKADIELGSPEELPFATALDIALHRFSLHQLGRISALSDLDRTQKSIREFLQRLGFTLQGLLPEQIYGLYQDRISILKNHGRFTGIDLLAKHHLPPFRSYHGLPFTKFRIDGGRLGKTLLTQRDDRSHWLTIETDLPVSPDIAETFLANSRFVLPNSVQIFLHAKIDPPVTSPSERTPEAKTKRFSGSFQLSRKDRLCPTSPK